MATDLLAASIVFGGIAFFAVKQLVVDRTARIDAILARADASHQAWLRGDDLAEPPRGYLTPGAVLDAHRGAQP